MTLRKNNSKQNEKFAHMRAARSSLSAEGVARLHVMQADVVSQLPPFTSCTPVCLKFPFLLGAITIVKQTKQLLQFSLQVFMASKGSCHLLRHAHNIIHIINPGIHGNAVSSLNGSRMSDAT